MEENTKTKRALIKVVSTGGVTIPKGRLCTRENLKSPLSQFTMGILNLSVSS